MYRNFSSFKDLKTERLLLRRPRIEDRDTIFFMRTDPSVNTYIQRVAPSSIEEVDTFIKDRIQDREEGKSIYYALALKESPNQYIGAITLWNFSEDRKTAEVGYDLYPDYQGKGYMSEAMTAILDFGFHTLDLAKIEAYTHHDNKASRNLLARHGFTLTQKKDADIPSNLVYQKVV